MLLWACFAATLLALIAADLTANPILDEAQWPEAGLAAVYNRFAKTALVVGPLYALVLGVVFSLLYAIGSVLGHLASPIQFFAWSFCHQGFFYLLTRCLTATIVLAGLALLARALGRNIGALSASALVVGFACNVPALAWMAVGTPHGAMIGYCALLLFALLEADRGSRWWWVVAGGVVGAAFATMTIGLGLGLLALAVAVLPGTAGTLPRSRRIGLLSGGFFAGLAVFGYPILLHPADYWNENLRYQLHRNVLTNEGGDGRLVRVWLTQAAPLWLAALAGVAGGTFRTRLAVAPAALVTAFGWIAFLALATQTQQVKYSLAVVPCLAYCASGLLRTVLDRRPAAAGPLLAAIVAVPVMLGAGFVTERLAHPDVKTVAAREMGASIPAGKRVLVDFFWGPRLANPRLLLARYGARGAEFARVPAFRDRVDRCLPADDNRWDILVYPHDVPRPDRTTLLREHVDYVVLSERTMHDGGNADLWRSLIDAGILLPVERVVPVRGGPDETIWFYRTAAAG